MCHGHRGGTEKTVQLEQPSQGRWRCRSLAGKASSIRASRVPSGHIYKCVGSYWNVLKREYDHTFAFKPLLLLQGRRSITGSQSGYRETKEHYCDSPDVRSERLAEEGVMGTGEKWTCPTNK